MANTFQLFSAVAVILLALTMASSSHARPLATLDSRLKLDADSPTCWDSLTQIHSCTGEVITFFLNGETYLSNACCHGIHTISHQCWPNMLETLGYTTEEGDILEGYCDHETANSLSSPLSVKAGLGVPVNGLLP